MQQSISSFFLRVFIQVQLWHGVVFGIVRHERIVMQVCSCGNNVITHDILPFIEFCYSPVR